MSPVVSIRYWAGAKAAASVESEDIEAPTVADALTEARNRHPALGPVLPASSVLLDGVAVSAERRAELLTGPVSVEVLPPFAGG